MAHIISCMLEGNHDIGSIGHHISKPASPLPAHDSQQQQQQQLPPLLEQEQEQEQDLSPVNKTPTPAEKSSHIWRMYQPERKYQLFPREKQQPAAPTKPEQPFTVTMGQAAEKTEKSSTGSGLRFRIKEHNLNRRRKVSVPELGPMTTVHEVPMDSPTIPGRPPLHERSISAPSHTLKPHHLADIMLSRKTPPVSENEELSSSFGSSNESISPFDMPKPASSRPLSPRSLAPLVIPMQGCILSKVTGQWSFSHSKSPSNSLDVNNSSRSTRTDDSPRTRTPYTPLSGGTTMTTPRSASTVATTSTAPTPVTATPVSVSMDARGSPKGWGETPTVTTPQERTGTSFFDCSVTPKGVSSEARPQPQSLANGHRRNQSESSGSIMDRGRPRKRSEIIPGGIAIGRSASMSKRSKSADRRAFESLPRGWKATEAITALEQSEAAALQKQALQQAARFEVLRKGDVEALSRELRQLDERTEYLRRTYASLRAGRRNLHSRICQYLRSPRVAKFSYDAMLKQEEALAELDQSIDDWVGKLEQAENRRTRVRQKLLEHVAAAATMPLSPACVKGVSESLQMAVGMRAPPSMPAGNISTPPRSPTRQPYSAQQSPTPQRFVPSTIMEQPLGEEDAAAADVGLSLTQATLPKPTPPTTHLTRADIQSIRIYAGDDVYALLADVENEITKMGELPTGQKDQAQDITLSDHQRKELHRAQSHELLNGLSKKSSANSISSTKSATTTPSPPAAATKPSSPITINPSSPARTAAPKDFDAPSPPAASLPPLPGNGEIFLTSAVFKP
ncbi:hypothetical protein RB601_004989 [Gaeumannomyces tritici]